MTKQVQLRRGTSAEHTTFTGAVGEVTIDTTLDVAVVHDGVKPGGHYLVGTGFGATVSQGLVNKSFIGIGTTSVTGFGLKALRGGREVSLGKREWVLDGKAEGGKEKQKAESGKQKRQSPLPPLSGRGG